MISIFLAQAEPVQQAAQLPWSSAAMIGAVVAIAMLAYKIADYLLSRAREQAKESDADKIVTAIRESLAPLSERVARIEGQVVRTREVAEKSWEMHNSFDDSGRPKWFMPHELSDVLQQVSRACERIAETQKMILDNQTALVETMRSIQVSQAAQVAAMEALVRSLPQRRTETI